MLKTVLHYGTGECDKLPEWELTAEMEDHGHFL